MSGRLNDLSRTIRQLVGFFFLKDLIRAKRSEERHLMYDYTCINLQRFKDAFNFEA